MAEPSEGTYIILNVNSQKAIDVKGSSDSSGANVQQWTKNNSDAQVWALDKQSNGWQIICSLTGKSLDVSSVASGQNVRQWSDNNSANQRWDVETDGKTYTYNSKSYNSYLIKAHSNTSLVLDVESGSTSAGANIRLYSSNNSNAQRWILIPAAVLTTEGAYEIVLAADTSMCIDIAGGSTASKANAQVYSRNSSNAQKFVADVDSQTFTVVLKNANSNKVLDIAGGTAKNGANIQQYPSNNTTAQKWLPMKSGSVKIDGETVPTYVIHSQAGNDFVMDCKGGGKTAKTNIQLYTENNSVAQKFAFVKTDIEDTTMSAPPAFFLNSYTDKNLSVSRVGPGDITISSLKISGLVYKMYKARYFIRYFTPGRASYTDTKWMNVKDDSTARSGWGDAWNYTVDSTLPDNATQETQEFLKHPYRLVAFNKTITLNANNHRSAEVYIQYREFVPTSVSGQLYTMYSPYTQVKISVTQEMQLSVSSFKFIENSSKTALGVSLKLTDSLNGKCEILRGRLIGSDGIPVTEWESSNSMTLSFYVDGSLRRIPDANEVCTLEYQMLTDDLAAKSSSISATFGGYGSNAAVVNPSLYTGIDTGDSCSVMVQNENVDHLYCFVEVPDSDGTIVKTCSKVSSISDRTVWECLPPLNKDVKLIVIGSTNGTVWKKGEITTRVNTHNFIWNWPEHTSYDYYDNYAIVIINTDAPPSQTRTYTTDIQFSNPMGRFFPVGFASPSLSGDVSVSGVIVDPDASYESSEPLPSNSTKEDILKLVRLSGKGIHPVYRTPYGDWYTVAVESVDISKSELYLSSVDVKQRAVDD